MPARQTNTALIWLLTRRLNLTDAVVIIPSTFLNRRFGVVQHEHKSRRPESAFHFYRFAV